MTKIGADGVYDLTMDEYHGDCCDGPSVSSSGLRKLLLECPAKYWATSPLNPNRFAEETTKALNIGRAAHAITLGEPEFAKYFVISPYDDFRKNEAREWRDAQTRTILKAPEFEMVLAVAAAQKRSAQVMRAFENGLPERSLIWRDKETGIWLKSRPDWLPHDPANGFLVEYKTAASIEPNKWAKDCFHFAYHLQGALQLDAVRAVLGVEPAGIAHCVQEKDPPYLAELRLLTVEQIQWGRTLYRRALTLFAECLKSDEWPGYTREPSYVPTPFSVAKDMEIGWTDDFHKPEKAAAE